MPGWLRVRYLRMLIASADKDVARYVDDERHAQRQQRVVSERRADLALMLRQLID